VVIIFIVGGNRSTKKETTDMPQVTDTLYHIKLYQVHLSMSGIRTYLTFLI